MNSLNNLEEEEIPQNIEDYEFTTKKLQFPNILSNPFLNDNNNERVNGSMITNSISLFDNNFGLVPDGTQNELKLDFRNGNSVVSDELILDEIPDTVYHHNIDHLDKILCSEEENLSFVNRDSITFIDNNNFH